MAGLKEMEARRVGINLSSVKANATDIARTTYNFPDYDTLLEEFLKVG